MNEGRDDPVVPQDRSAICFGEEFSLTELPRRTLAELGREWLLHGHLQDRIGMPLVHAGRSRQEMQAVAIDEWMATSPVYSKRVQRALNFEGDSVQTIFKNLQLDIGSPHQFLDFRFVLHDDQHGEFFLAHCGALMDVEPLGEEYVHGMCHTIEDPTFDATAGATNARAQVRPVHRPPRIPPDRQPHCAWTVAIDESHPPVGPHPHVATVARSLAARCVVADPGPSVEPGGWDDYSGPFDPEFALEDLSQRALIIALQEVALQSHLLVRGFGLAAAKLAGAEEAAAMISRMAVGLGGLTAERLTRAFSFTHGVAGLAALLQVHPFFWPRTYVRPSIELRGDRLRFALGAASAIFDEGDDLTWLAAMAGPADGSLLAIAQGFDPRAQVRQLPPGTGERCAYELWIDRDAPPATEPVEVSLAKFSTGAGFRFAPRRALRR